MGSRALHAGGVLTVAQPLATMATGTQAASVAVSRKVADNVGPPQSSAVQEMLAQLSQDLSNIGLKLYEGSFREFYDEVFVGGKTGRMGFNAGEITEDIALDVKQKLSSGSGLCPLRSNIIVVMDKTIVKYANHPKAKKGAVVPSDRAEEIMQIIKFPEHIYEDHAGKDMVYVCTGKATNGKVIKVVIHPNYVLKKGVMTNVAKSWGIVEESKMRGQQYRQIK